jgi:hypothetical protein
MNGSSMRAARGPAVPCRSAAAADKEQLFFFASLERRLEGEFFRPPEKRATMTVTCATS